ncbi:hypothetical protein A7985_24380 [Pseudoalteromonas luteoviolacea]|uniref:Periplasmic heavy metal sensor n=1 Tax=Pseudoalteromonas luteoviolacea TaxID=43657 RepID=A0A1C0TJ11_9GAMM|nr:Spy/CpxP family protein refolding chaperone [Pseudoalteromonas luteoviolacea]MBQ4814149.1 Spy/CpxP family protein refolding chaperone [Pseudoalteromonas luteoviolacea]OCQ18255.1 hypothetical protein A7985_24380 [Pseudoalteromonas luteoviolacea]
MKKLASLLLASCVSVGMIPSAAFADDGSNHVHKAKRHHMKPLAHIEKRLLSKKAVRHLGLSDAQQTELKSVFETYKSRLAALKETQPQNKPHKAFKEVIEAESFDKAQAQLLLEEYAPKKQAFMLTMLEARHAIHHILTPEQREKIAKRKDKFLAKLHHRN